ncbi:carcinoembryonic antigen-related cell adhesion molecule 1-like, partial [Phyllostomus hastatus]|uniref:carcinoembryonic antigen-related cell adhesion molecule 1-like n=1 Tax=Phyllostomus hastatus TaxID=9423 RepID=UPI001E685865
MESRLATTARQGLLLAFSLLTFRSPPSTAQLTVASINSTEGKDVLLLVLNLPENLVGYAWYRGESMDNNSGIASYVIHTQEFTPGPAHSGRETIYPNGSLLFQNITLKDTGYYTIQAIKKTFQNEEAKGHLCVYAELPRPSITNNNSNPEEHKASVLLMCEPHTQDTTYLWLINSQSLQDSTRLELSKDNRTLTLLHVTRTDTGPYECETRNPVSAGRSDPFTLNVFYGPDVPSTSPSDPHYPPGANLRLSCHTASNPPAQYSWFINGRPQQPTQELFIPSITASDSGSYTRLAHNSVTGLNRTTVKNTTVSDVSTSPSPGISGGAIAGIMIGVLAAVALTAALVYFLYIRKTGGANKQSNLTEHKPSASNHNPVHSDNSPYKIHEFEKSSLDFNAQELKKPPSASPFPRATETVSSKVKKESPDLARILLGQFSQNPLAKLVSDQPPYLTKFLPTHHSSCIWKITGSRTPEYQMRQQQLSLCSCTARHPALQPGTEVVLQTPNSSLLHVLRFLPEEKFLGQSGPVAFQDMSPVVAPGPLSEEPVQRDMMLKNYRYLLAEDKVPGSETKDLISFGSTRKEDTTSALNIAHCKHKAEKCELSPTEQCCHQQGIQEAALWAAAQKAAATYWQVTGTQDLQPESLVSPLPRKAGLGLHTGGVRGSSDHSADLGVLATGQSELPK